MNTVEIFVFMVLVGVPSSYALNRWRQGKKFFGVMRPAHSRRSSLLFALALWTYVAFFVVLIITFSSDFWLVSGIYFGGGYLLLVAYLILKRRRFLKSK
jgi:hypothetical protein